MMSDANFAIEVRASAIGWNHKALELLEALTALDAPSGDKALLNRMADLLTSELGELGADIRRIQTPVGDHLEARLGTGSGDRILLLGHYDTVWPAGTAAARPLAVKDNIVIGPGVFDMRGGIVATLVALHILQEIDGLQRPITFLLTADEETGSIWSEREIRRIGSTVRTVLVPEPPLPGGKLKTSRKGVLTYEVRVTGIAAHAGLNPELGASAISEMVSIIRRLDQEARPELGTTVNVGVMSAGTRSNVVAAEAIAQIDIRVATMAEYGRICEVFDHLTTSQGGTSVESAFMHGRPPMERTPAIIAALTAARDLVAAIDIELEEGMAGGASDGNFLAPEGIAVLDGLGPHGGGAHALDEHIILDTIIERAILLAILIARM